MAWALYAWLLYGAASAVVHALNLTPVTDDVEPW